tara:strand:- start:5091 stop:5588 length:498 start_codon:yes stop_codon:yes gene_type:complete
MASDYVGNHKRIPAIENRPPQVGRWATPPKIIICEHAPVTKSQIDKAIRFWKRLGYEFSNIHFKQNLTKICLSDNPYGHILIHLVTKGTKIDSRALAQTHFYVNNATSNIDWAIIYIRSSPRDTVLEHELGHALGFLHFNKINHLMNQTWEMGGWDTKGLSNNQK